MWLEHGYDRARASAHGAGASSLSLWEQRACVRMTGLTRWGTPTSEPTLPQRDNTMLDYIDDNRVSEDCLYQSIMNRNP